MLNQSSLRPGILKSLRLHCFARKLRASARLAGSAIGIALACANAASPAETKAASPDPNGTWRWTFTTSSGEAFERSVKLKQEGDKLTGFSTWPGGVQVAIQAGKIKGNEISFTLSREQQGLKHVSKYSGKIQGDTITGKIESNLDGEKRDFEWKAKREQEKK